MIRVLLVDDHTLVREGLRVLLHLTPDIRVVAEAGNGRDALAAVADATVDVLLPDIKMPGMTGLETMRALSEGHVLPPTIVLTTFDDDVLVLDAIRAGARGFLLKDATFDELTGAIRSVAAGGTQLRPGVTERVLNGATHVDRSFDAADAPDGLTLRERDVVRLLAGGYSNKEIAYALDMADGTAKNHVSNILSKLGVRDRTRAVLRALELGWL